MKYTIKRSFKKGIKGVPCPLLWDSKRKVPLFYKSDLLSNEISFVPFSGAAHRKEIIDHMIIFYQIH